MKKFVKVISCFLFASTLGLTACGSSDSAESSKAPESSSKETPKTSSVEPSGSTGSSQSSQPSGGGSSSSSAHTHTFSNEWSSDAEHHWRAATCEHTDQVENYGEHNFNDGVVTTWPTYESTGIKTYTCITCHYQYTEVLQKYEHQYETGYWQYNEEHHYHGCTDYGYEDLHIDEEEHNFTSYTSQPTYDWPGYTRYSCSECGYEYSESIPALEHHYSSQWTVGKYNVGWQEYVGHYHQCTDVGYEYLFKDEGPHEFGDWETDQEASYDINGKKHRTCSVCGYVEEDIIPYIGDVDQLIFEDAYTEGECQVVGYKEGLTGDVLIPEYFEGNKVTKISSYAFLNCEDITSVTVPSTLQRISDHAFKGCSNLKTVYWEATQCYGSSNSYGYFEDCPKLETVIVGRQVKNMPDHLLEYSAVKTVAFGDSLRSIPSYVCRGCENLETVTMGPEVASINGNAFDRCKNLQEFTIGSNVSYIDYSAFAGCTGLEEFTVAQGNSGYYEVDGALARKDSTGIILEYCPLGKTGEFDSSRTKFVGRLSIANKAFENVKGLTSVVLKSNVSSLSNGAFVGCENLESVELDACKATVYIESSVGYKGPFAGLEKLTKVVVDGGTDPKNKYDIEKYMFSDIPNLDEVTFTNVGKIKDYAFLNSGLSSISLEGITSIGTSAFKNTKLKNVVIPEGLSVEGSAQSQFADCKELESVTFNNDVESIPNSMFEGCEKLSTVNLPNTVLQIGYSAFKDCILLENIAIPSSVASIHSEAFSGCSILRAVKLPSTLTEIGADAFDGCSKLFTVIDKSNLGIIKGDEGNGKVAYYALEVIANPEDTTIKTDEKGFKTLIEDEKVTLIDYIGDYEEVVVPDEVEVIADYAFAGLPIKKLTIGENVAKIGFGAVQGCNYLEELHIPFAGSSRNPSQNDFYFAYILGCDTFQYADKYALPNLKTLEIGSFADEYAKDYRMIGGTNSVENLILGRGVHYFIGTGSGSTGELNHFKTLTLDCEFAPSYLSNYTSRYMQFQWFSKLEKLIIGEHCTLLPADLICQENVSGNTFKQQEYLKEIEIHSALTLSEGTFRNLIALESVIFVDGGYLVNAPAKSFENCYKLEAIDLSHVTEIGEGAFANCRALHEATFGDGLEIINANAFSNVMLENLILPNTLVSIGKNAFGTSNYGKVVLPFIGSSPTDEMSNVHYILNGSYVGELVVKGGLLNKEAFINLVADKVDISALEVTKIPDNCFENCTAATIILPALYTSIGDSAFCHSKIQEITFPETLQSIGTNAFLGSELRNIVIPDSVTTLGSRAFANTKYLETAVIGKGIDEHDKLANAFEESNIIQITFPENYDVPTDGLSVSGYPLFSIIGPESTTEYEDQAYEYVRNAGTSLLVNDKENKMWVYHDEENCKHILVRYYGDAEEFMIPEGFTAIWAAAFQYNSTVKNLVIPDTVTSIGRAAFQDTVVESVTLPEGLTEIPDEAFLRCYSLEEINIPDTVTEIGGSAFAVCNSLANIELPEGLLIINAYAFQDTKLVEITVPSTVTTIGEKAFYKCGRLQEATILSEITVLSDYMFRDCTSLRKVTLPNTLKTIGKGAFYNCESLSNFVFPDSVTSIGQSAFSNCSNLKHIVLPEGLTMLDSYTFYYCSSLEDIVIPNSVHTVYEAFEYADSLKDTYIYVEGIEDFNQIFANSSYRNFLRGEVHLLDINNDNKEIKELTIGGTKIRGSNYARLTIEKVTIQEGVTEIENSAFDGCHYLKEVSLPSTLNTMGICVFEDCYSLTEIVIPDAVKIVHAGAFTDCHSLAKVTIGSGVTKIENRYLGFDVPPAFQNCYALAEVINRSNLTLTLQSNDNGYVAYYAKQIITDPADSKVVFKDGFALYNDEDDNYVLAYLGDDTEIVIPDGVTVVVDNFLSRDEKITAVTLPSSVRKIGSYAFYSMKNRERITILSDNLESVGSNAFIYSKTGEIYYTVGAMSELRTYLSSYYSQSFRSKYLIIPSVEEWLKSDYTSNANVHVLDASNGYEEILNLVIPEGTTEIRDNAFKGFEYIVSVTVPSTITDLNDISDSAFDSYSKLTTIINHSDLVIDVENNPFGNYVREVVTDINDSKLRIGNDGYIGFETEDDLILIGYLGSEFTIDVPERFTKYTRDSFNLSGFTRTVYVHVSDFADWLDHLAANTNFNALNIYLFDDDDNLISEYVIPETVTQLEEYMFSCLDVYCTLVIPTSVTKIYYYAITNRVNSITYLGTIDEWISIGYNGSRTGLVVHCTDGDYVIN